MASEVAVASVVYNMAGGPENRPDYLKALTVQQVFSKASDSMGSAITQGMLKGPAFRMRNFYNWATNPANFDEIGLPSGSIQSDEPPDEAVVAAAVPQEIGDVVTIDTLSIDLADPAYWAERWILENRPTDIALDWSYAIDDAGDYITIVFPDGSPTPLIEVIPATLPTFNASGYYIYARYTLSTSPTVDRLFIYGVGDGNQDLDDLISSSVSYGSFFPFIPIRLNNQFLSESYLPDAYAQTTRAYRKVMDGAKISDLVELLETNPSLDDIDHACIMFGVSLNVQDNASRRYLYNFFKSLRDIQIGGPTTTSLASQNIVTIKGQTSVSSFYDIRLSWRYFSETTGSGLGKVDADVGEFWFQKNGTVSSGSKTYEKLRLYWQETDSTYRYLELVGFFHYNYVYGSKRVEISAFSAIDDTEESGFVVPLHYDVWRETSLISTSQVATACTFIVFNCYEVHKTQWWETGIFRIFLVIVIAVVSVLFTGGAGFGLLGAHLALGTALGFTGMTAAIVGAVVNALAAMILISLLDTVLKPLGPMAPVIAAVLMFVIGQAAGSFVSAGTLTVNWGDLLRADNLLAMTSAVGQGFTGQINAGTLQLQDKSVDYLNKAKAETTKIQQALFEEFGYGSWVIDPLSLTEALNKDLVAESSATFLTRTLMTGSEIAEMSRELLYDFPTYSLKLPDAFT